MKVFWLIIVILGVALVATGTLYAPQILAKNEFLQGFVTYEIMSFLIVIVTITFASVANIHLWVNRTQRNIGNTATRDRLERQFAKPLRDETISSAWLLFWGLVIVGIALVIKGQFPDNLYVRSAVNGTASLVLIMNGVVLYDIYATVFALVGLDAGNGEEQTVDP